MARGVALDMTALSPGEKVAFGAAGLYLVWSFFPTWYAVDVPGGSGRISAWHGPTIVSSVAAILAVAWTVLRASSTVTIRSRARPAAVDLGLAWTGLAFTVAAFVVPPHFFGMSWGLAAGTVLSITWAWGASRAFAATGRGGTTGR